MSQGDELTVIVPVFNRIESVTRAVSTVVGQSERIAVAVVDDGSAGECAAALDELASEGSRIQVFHQPNKGPAAARNTGLEHVNSRFVMFLDSDDELAQGAFAAMYPILSQDDVGMLCGAVSVVSPNGGWRTDYPAAMRAVPWAKLSWSHSFAVRTDVARAVGGYDEALRFGENTDFILRLAEECRRRSLRVVATDEVLYRFHVASDERRYDANRLDAALHLLRRGRFDLHLPSEHARLHAIAAVNAARVRRYRLAVKQCVLAVLAEPRNPRHLVRFTLSLSGPLARRRWLKT